MGVRGCIRDEYWTCDDISEEKRRGYISCKDCDLSYGSPECKFTRRNGKYKVIIT